MSKIANSETVIIYYPKKFKISCAFFFVLSISNSYRIWKDQQIKQQFSEDIPYKVIFNFCEKQFILNDTTLILQKILFWPQNTKFCKFYVLTIPLLLVFKISLELMQCYLFYHVLYSHSHNKNGKFSKVMTIEKSISLYIKHHLLQ